MSELRSCGVLILREREDGAEFLLMKHKNRWDLPKGHVDPGETDLQCALREMEEETGIRADQIELDDDFQFTTRYSVKSKRTGGEWRTKTLVVFLARLQEDVEITPTEHPDYRWFPWEPPHVIQEQTIDPLLADLAGYLGRD